MEEHRVLAPKTVSCSSCGHSNDPRAEWCDRCLTDVDPSERRTKRPARASTRIFPRPIAPDRVVST